MVQANYSFIKKIFRKSIHISCGYFLFNALTLCLQVSSADNLRKQFGPRPGQTICLAWSGSKLSDALMVLLKEFFEKVNFEKYQQTAKNHGK